VGVSRALFWDEQRARAELEREASTDDSLSSFEAKIILREFDAGRLNTSWTPKGTVNPNPRPDSIWYLSTLALLLECHSRGHAEEPGEFGLEIQRAVHG